MMHAYLKIQKNSLTVKKAILKLITAINQKTQKPTNQQKNQKPQKQKPNHLIVTQLNNPCLFFKYT